MTASLCETCHHMREVVSGKGSRFLLCELSKTNSRFPKYPVQPVVRCEEYLRRPARDEAEADSSRW